MKRLLIATCYRNKTVRQRPMKSSLKSEKIPMLKAKKRTIQYKWKADYFNRKTNTKISKQQRKS